MTTKQNVFFKNKTLKMAERGFIALAFDASHQGESEPRYLEDTVACVEDIRCAIDYLVTLLKT